jgi:hypothetical protein
MDGQQLAQPLDMWLPCQGVNSNLPVHLSQFQSNSLIQTTDFEHCLRHLKVTGPIYSHMADSEADALWKQCRQFKGQI